MFGGFINGKILDSAIIGVLCYIACLIFKFPSALLVSVIIGVTNVIPFFGPFIGAIPATLLILIQNPIKALWFVLFVLVLQQVDGNIIGTQDPGQHHRPFQLLGAVCHPAVRRSGGASWA